MKRLHALVILAWALLRALFPYVFGGRRGLAAFRASYAGLEPVTPDERRDLPAMSGCIACGRCGVDVMDLALASSRSFPDHDAAARALATLDDGRLAEVEVICPGRVPLRSLKALVLAKGARAGEPH